MRHFVVSALLVGACIAAPADGRKLGSCGYPTGVILAQDGASRLFESNSHDGSGHRVCSRVGRGAVHDFGFRYEESPLGAGGVGLRRFRVTGRWGAAVLRGDDSHYGEPPGEAPRRLDLRRGTYSELSGLRFDPGLAHIRALEVNRTGDVAWTSVRPDAPVEIWLANRGHRGRLVAAGPGIDPRRLVLTDEAVEYWQDGKGKRAPVRSR